MKILVTGAAGFIGYFVSKELCKSHQVVGLDNLSDYYDVNLKRARLEDIKSANFSFVQEDLTNKKAINTVFKENKFDQVIHLAAQAGVRYSLLNPQAYIDSNVTGYLNILESCKDNGIKKLIYASSSSVYGNCDTVPFSENERTDSPVSLYAATKKSNELMANVYNHLYGISIIGLRFFTVYGPFGRPDMAPFLFADSIFNKREIKVFNNGDLKRDFTYIDDIVQGVIRTSQKDTSSISHKIFNIGHGGPVHLMDFISCMEEEIGIEAIKNFVPMQPGDVYKTYANTNQLEKLTGFKPQIGLKEGVHNFINWYKEYYKY